MWITYTPSEFIDLGNAIAIDGGDILCWITGGDSNTPFMMIEIEPTLEPRNIIVTGTEVKDKDTNEVIGQLTHLQREGFPSGGGLIRP